MRKVVFLCVIFFAFEQIWSATDEEVQKAYDELYNLTTDLIIQMDGTRKNYSESILQILHTERSEGREAINKTLQETLEKIKTISDRASAFDNIDTSDCLNHVSDVLDQYATNLILNLEFCLYEMRYQTLTNQISTSWTEIAHVAMGYMTCTEREMTDCKGDAACGDKILEEIEQNKQNLPYTIGLLGADMINIFDGFTYECKGQIVADFHSYSSNILNLVRRCVDKVIQSFAPLIC